MISYDSLAFRPYFNHDHTLDIATEHFGHLFAVGKRSVKISHARSDVPGTQRTAKRWLERRKVRLRLTALLAIWRLRG
jgi:hypothetical protein